MRSKLFIILTLFLFVFGFNLTPANASLTGYTWSHYAGHGPYVKVEDYTGSAWPVKQGVSNWHFGLVYGACTTGQCVRVHEVNWGRNGIIGTTVATYNPLNHRFITVNIYMNDAYKNLDYNHRQEAVTHELGHALGLGHDNYRDVMYPYIWGYTTISTFERNELLTAYK